MSSKNVVPADEVLSALRFETKLEKATLARMTFAISLTKEGPDVAPSTSFTGAELMGKLYQECGRDADSLLMRLVEEVEFGGRRETAGHGLDIFIGRTLQRFHDRSPGR